MKLTEVFEWLIFLVFLVGYCLIIYTTLYYLCIIRLVSKVPTEWSYFLFEKALISVDVKYEVAFFQALKAIKELGIRIKKIDFDNGRIEGIFMPNFISLLFKTSLIGKKLLIELTRLPLRENTFSIAINIIPNSRSRLFPFKEIIFIRSKSFFINRFIERFMSKPK